MKTIEKLQATLAKPNRGGIVKELSDRIVCKDGTYLSVQASLFHYSKPRKNTGPYSEVEVWCIEPKQVVTEFDYSASNPAAYVPIEKVVQFIDNHGGMV